jgi:hypothetical protein
MLTALRIDRCYRSVELLSKLAIVSQAPGHFREPTDAELEEIERNPSALERDPRHAAIRALDELIDVAAACSLHMTKMGAVRTREIVIDSPPEHWSHPIEQLLVTLKDEASLWVVLGVTPSDADFYRCDRPPFGDTVAISFPSVAFDIEEASKCYALGRYTASVLHLMRALEPVLKAISDELAIQKHSPTWQAYLSAMPRAIEAKFSDKTSTHAEMREYFSGLEGHLRAVKNAWRNPSFHMVAKTYTDETARNVFNSVKSLVCEAASKLHE